MGGILNVSWDSFELVIIPSFFSIKFTGTPLKILPISKEAMRFPAVSSSEKSTSSSR